MSEDVKPRKKSPKTFVIDTSVLLSDPRAPLRFADNKVVIPLVVVSELEDKRHHPELGYFARKALHLLDDLRIVNKRLDQEVPVGDQGGTLTIELGLTDSSVLPGGIRNGDNDTRILAVAQHLADDGHRVTVVSKDVPMRVKAAAIGLRADEYLNEHRAVSGYSGVIEAEVLEDTMSSLWDSGTIPAAEVMLTPSDTGFSSALEDDDDLEVIETDDESVELVSDEELFASVDASDLPVHTGLVLTSPRGSALGVLESGGVVRLVKADRDVFGVRGRSAEQRIAIDHLTNPKVGIVSLGGRAGTGKSAIALAAGLEAVVEHRQHYKVMVFRPIYAVGGQSLGYLPGSGDEKMGPWAQAVFDTLGSLVGPEVIDEVVAREQLEVLPLTHIRGRSFHNAFVIVDEAQSLERNVLLTVLSRVGQNAKVVLTHDVSQRDNLRVGRYDGIAAVIEDLKGQELFAHTTLKRSERSEIADLVTTLLDV
ncbi:MAG: PhoH family protein [Actinomycetaceae bacterium]|nr:PhoH family protein [Actinomycetaceae bacterium]